MAELSGADGVKVAVFVDASYAVAPDTAAPPGSVTASVAPVTAWSNPTDTAVLTETFIAPGAGDWEVTAGAAALVKVHETGAMTPPPDEVAPETVTV
jgi:hypothetical protein